MKTQSPLIKLMSVTALALMLGACSSTGTQTSQSNTTSSATSAAVTDAQRTDAMDAARLNRAEALSKLLQQGVDPNTKNSNGNTLLMMAAQEESVDTLKVLIAAKADLAARDKVGDSALMKAIIRENDTTREGAVAKGLAVKRNGAVEALLSAGAPVNYSSGWTPVLYAAYVGNDALLERLISMGGDVQKAAAPNGSSALMLAAANGHTEVVKRLLKMGVNVNVKNDTGLTAETWARKNNHTAIADMIKAEAARGRK